MVFGRKAAGVPVAPIAEEGSHSGVLVLGSEQLAANKTFREKLSAALPVGDTEFVDPGSPWEDRIAKADAVLSVWQDKAGLAVLLEQVQQLRQLRQDGTPVLIICSRLGQLEQLGRFLYESAVGNRLSGIRLIVTNDPQEFSDQLAGKIQPIFGSNVIRMPVSTEVENTAYKYLYTISPELRQVTELMRQYAENSITRIYLLGGPGTGKTSVAYYYWLCRNHGRFITVNLTAESTGDKAAMKSLLCGHVVGAFPGAQSREGALSFAEDGVCFLDESHGVTGVMMQVLMEVLDSGQFLPYGATKKRELNCAVIFASNRSWETLRSLIHVDEHARLGASLVKIPDLAVREEDLIAVLATTLSKFAGQCTTWTPPQGLTEEAWTLIKNCPWRGNVRTLIRTTESAAISYCTKGPQTGLIDAAHVSEGLNLWEPLVSEDKEIYSSFGRS